MLCSSRVLLAAALGLLAAGPAAAQALGTYTGSSADGQSVSFTVSTDPSSGAPELTSATIFYNAACPDGAPSDNAGIGYGPNVDFAAGKLTYVSGLPTSTYFSYKLAYDKSTSALTGTIVTVATLLAPVSAGVPKKAYVCTAPKQTLSATLQAAGSGKAAVAAASASVAYVYDRHGRVVGTLGR